MIPARMPANPKGVKLRMNRMFLVRRKTLSFKCEQVNFNATICELAKVRDDLPVNELICNVVIIEVQGPHASRLVRGVLFLSHLPIPVVLALCIATLVGVALPRRDLREKYPKK